MKKEKIIERDDPKELDAIGNWGLKRGTKCGHNAAYLIEILPFNSSNTSRGGWHPCWNAKVTVKCRTCGGETAFEWVRNDHKDETFEKQ